jgi:hypothetical protein
MSTTAPPDTGAPKLRSDTSTRASRAAYLEGLGDRTNSTLVTETTPSAKGSSQLFLQYLPDPLSHALDHGRAGIDPTLVLIARLHPSDLRSGHGRH